MLPSFHIENFRGFKELTVERLARVNLIVGKNNVGKSSFLDAVALYFTEYDKDTILLLLKKRHEIDASDNLSTSIMYPFFYDYSPKDEKKKTYTTIKLSLKDSEPVVSLEAKNKVNIIIDGEIHHRINMLGGYDELDNFISLSLKTNDQEKSHPTSYPIRTKNTCHVVYISPDGLTDEAVFRLWSLFLKDYAPLDMVKELQRLDLQVEKFFFKDVGNNLYLPFVSIKNRDVPLKSLGDGMTRIFHIMLAMMHAKDNIVLIDEFENGLHWSVQEEVWKKIFLLAEKLNVQVFATTHSRDCVQAFSEVWKEQAEIGAYFRLFQDDKQVKVQEYNARLLANSITYDAETR